MKNLITISLLTLGISIVTLNACKKADQSQPQAQVAPAATTSTMALGKPLVSNLTLGDDPSCFHCYWCVQPATDCVKVIFGGPTGKMETTGDVDFKDFMTAVDQHKEKDFFKTTKWKSFLPNLSAKTLADIQTGDVIVMKIANANRGTTVYCGAPKNIDQNKSIVGNTRFAIEYSIK